MVEAPPADAGLAPLEVHAERTYVIGAPIHVAIVVRANGPHTTFPALPPVDWRALRGAVGVEVRGAETDEEVYRLDVTAQIFEERGDLADVLHAGESRRMLVDLSECLEGVLAPNDYRLVVSYGTAALHTRSAPLALSMRTAAEAERANLDAVAAARSAAGSWGAWASRPASEAPDERLREGPSGLWFAAVARAVMFGRAAVSSEDLALLEALPPFYAPERRALEMELRRALEGEDRASPAIAALLRDHPEMSHRVRALHEGESWLQRPRAH